MKTLKTLTLILAAMMLWGSVEVMAATETANLTINATVSNSAKLTLSVGTILFGDADPDQTTLIPSTPATVTVTAKAKTGSSGAVTLTVAAAGDLVSTAGDQIGITNVKWTGSGTGFVLDGIMNTTGQPVASWTGPGNRSGDLTFGLVNSWDYAVGNYSATTTFTLTSP
jgi:hypothetical protein